MLPSAKRPASLMAGIICSPARTKEDSARFRALPEIRFFDNDTRERRVRKVESYTALWRPARSLKRYLIKTVMSSVPFLSSSCISAVLNCNQNSAHALMIVRTRFNRLLN